MVEHHKPLPPVTHGGTPLDQPALLQDSQVVSQQVASRPAQLRKLARLTVSHHQCLDYPKPGRVSQGSMDPGCRLNSHISKSIDSIVFEQTEPP